MSTNPCGPGDNFHPQNAHLIPIRIRRFQEARLAGVAIVSTLKIHAEVAMRVIVKKWGNSASVRIPAAIMAAAKLHLDETVDVREEGGRIVIEPVRPDECDLESSLPASLPKTCTPK